MTVSWDHISTMVKAKGSIILVFPKSPRPNLCYSCLTLILPRDDCCGTIPLPFCSPSFTLISINPFLLDIFMTKGNYCQLPKSLWGPKKKRMRSTVRSYRQFYSVANPAIESLPQMQVGEWKMCVDTGILPLWQWRVAISSPRESACTFKHCTKGKVI